VPDASEPRPGPKIEPLVRNERGRSSPLGFGEPATAQSSRCARSPVARDRGASVAARRGFRARGHPSVTVRAGPSGAVRAVRDCADSRRHGAVQSRNPTIVYPSAGFRPKKPVATSGRCVDGTSDILCCRMTINASRHQSTVRLYFILEGSLIVFPATMNTPLPR